MCKNIFKVFFILGFSEILIKTVLVVLGVQAVLVVLVVQEILVVQVYSVNQSKYR